MTSELFVTKLGEIITAVPSSATRDRRRAAIAIGLVKANAEDSLRCGTSLETEKEAQALGRCITRLPSLC